MSLYIDGKKVPEQVGTNIKQYYGSGNSGWLWFNGTQFELGSKASCNIRLLPGTGGITQIGDAGATSHSLAANDDLFVSGKLEVDSTSYFDTDSYFATWLYCPNISISSTFSDYGGIVRGVDDGTRYCVGSTTDKGNRNLIITDSANYGKAHGHTALSTNPTLFIHSVTDPTAGDATQWLSLSHDTNKAVASCGKGDFTFAVDIDATGGYQTELAAWIDEDLAAELTASAMTWNATSRTEVPTVRAGSVVGIAVYSNEARSAGSATFQATVDGTAITGHDAVLDGSATQTKCVTIAKNEHTFTAGQRIGVKVTTTADWAPTTADVTVVVLIEQ